MMMKNEIHARAVWFDTPASSAWYEIYWNIENLYDR